MKCLRCDREALLDDKYCSSCKKEIEKELENEIIKHRKNNDLEITKELPTLTDLNEDEFDSTDVLSDEFKGLVNIEREEKITKILIILGVLFGIIAIVVSLLFILKKDDEPKEEESVINYEEILNEYGDLVLEQVKLYMDNSVEVPSWSIINNLIDYDKHNVMCNTHNIYKDKSIYLTDCTIDKTSIKYSYGEKKINIEGKKINIYLNDNIYTTLESDNKLGSITCITEDCEFISGYSKYVLIEESSKYYIYNYEKNSMEFGPFDLINNDYNNNLLFYEDILYGVLYEENNIKYIYNLSKSKTFKDIKGEVLSPTINLNSNLLYKYGYIIFKENNINNFINLKTGNISYKIEGNLSTTIEDVKNKILYMTTYNSTNKKITIYNSNGKKLFEGKEYNNFRLLDDGIAIYDDTNYYIYDNNLKLILKSKTYNNVLALLDAFAVVIDGVNLQIVDLNDSVLAKYDFTYDDTYKFDNASSGKMNVDNKEIIYLVFEKDDEVIKYYYEIDSKEYGKVS